MNNALCLFAVTFLVLWSQNASAASLKNSGEMTDHLGKLFQIDRLVRKISGDESKADKTDVDAPMDSRRKSSDQGSKGSSKKTTNNEVINSHRNPLLETFKAQLKDNQASEYRTSVNGDAPNSEEEPDSFTDIEGKSEESNTESPVKPATEDADELKDAEMQYQFVSHPDEPVETEMESEGPRLDGAQNPYPYDNMASNPYQDTVFDENVDDELNDGNGRVYRSLMETQYDMDSQ